MLNANGTYANGSNTQTNAKPPAPVVPPQSKALMLTSQSGLYKVFSTESVLTLLHCMYCKRPYKDPRLIHCGHTFCLTCLVQMNRYSTIRCIKCNYLQTVTSHAVDQLPKNLFIADIQSIPTVEIDRGAAYKDTLKSLEDLKLKLLDFSDKLDQSEEKLYTISNQKKNDVSDQIQKLIDQIRSLEYDFHNEIDEFRNNRLAILRSAPPEFKETNANLLQFVNQSIEDLMRADIKEEDVKEIYNRCEEHRRLWNETEIIYNSNYAIGEIHFQVNTSEPQKDIVGEIIQKFPQKLNAQRTAKGPISITECCIDGEYIVIENTSKRNDINMTNWLLTHCVGSVRKVNFKFPENFILRSKQTVKLWASGRSSQQSVGSQSTKSSKPSFSSSSSLSSSNSSLSSKSNGKENSINITSNGYYLYNDKTSGTNSTGYNSTVTLSNSPINGDMTTIDQIENELVLYDIENWTCGSQEMFVRIENEYGEEKACFRKTN